MIDNKYKQQTRDGCFDESARESGLVVACSCMAGAVLAVLTMLGMFLGVIG